MGKEIERKFLVRSLPDLDMLIPFDIKQGYIAIMENGGEVRLRISNDRYFLTVKDGEGLIRSEIEIDLSSSQFEQLWPLTEGKRVEKKRYKIQHDGVLIELDIYSGHLEGLVTAEIEFSSLEHARQYDPPHWLGTDVTEDKRYKNGKLATQGLPA